MFFNKDNFLRTFKDLPDIIETYVKNIPENYFDIKRTDDSWTIREHLYHIVNAQEMLYQRILKIKEEENPVITPYFPENESENNNLYGSIDIAFAKYKKIREKQIDLINQLVEADYSKEAKHGEYINYNIPIILNHIIFHEYWHMYRVEEIWLTKNEYFI